MRQIDALVFQASPRGLWACASRALGSTPGNSG